MKWFRSDNDKLDRIINMISALLEQYEHLSYNQEKMMALIDDVQTAVNTLGTDVSALITAESTKIQALITQVAAGGAATTAQLQAVHDGLTALDAAVKTATGNIPA